MRPIFGAHSFLGAPKPPHGYASILFREAWQCKLHKKATYHISTFERESVQNARIPSWRASAGENNRNKRAVNVFGVFAANQIMPLSKSSGKAAASPLHTMVLNCYNSEHEEGWRKVGTIL